jgi:2-dehydropantoate 2-reductase
VIVGVLGAGAIGGYLGVSLSAAGLGVRMLGRPALVAVADALVAYDRKGRARRPSDDFVVDTDPRILRDVDVCLVTVKSRDTVEAARILADALPSRALVVSFQNGLRNAERLRQHTDHRVSAGMVAFNVVRPEPGIFRQATRGPLVVERVDGQPARWLGGLRDAAHRVALDFEIVDDIHGVQAGKLLLNLNNVVCAVTGVSIAESVRSRTLRWCFSQLMKEGSRVMKAAGLGPRAVVGLPPGLIARLLTLPDFVVLRVGKSMVDIDPTAKSSTLQDLEADKPTEVDDLCGEIVRLAERSGGAAPLNAAMVEAIHALEAAPVPKPFWTPARLAQRLGALR